MVFWEMPWHHLIELYWIWALNTTTMDISAIADRCTMPEEARTQYSNWSTNGVQCLCCPQVLMMKLGPSDSSCRCKACPLSISLWRSWRLSDSTISWCISLTEQKNLHFLPVGLFCPVLTPWPAHHRVIGADLRKMAGLHPTCKWRGAAWHFLAAVIF